MSGPSEVARGALTIALTVVTTGCSLLLGGGEEVRDGGSEPIDARLRDGGTETRPDAEALVPWSIDLSQVPPAIMARVDIYQVSVYQESCTEGVCDYQAEREEIFELRAISSGKFGSWTFEGECNPTTEVTSPNIGVIITAPCTATPIFLLAP